MSICPFTINYHGNLDDSFRVTVELGPPVEQVDRSYMVRFGYDLCLFVSDEQRQQLMSALSAAPPMPKPDEQADAEREDAGFAPTMGDVEVFRG